MKIIKKIIKIINYLKSNSNIIKIYIYLFLNLNFKKVK